MKILFILHLPPPVHGASLVGQSIKDSKIINDVFECNYINLSTSRRIEDIGKNPLQKVSIYLAIIYKVLRQLYNNRPAICYYTLTAKGIAFYKDFFVVLIVKFFKVKLVYHFHNKGVFTRQNNIVDNFLYRMVFNNSRVILLSEHLYYDIQKYVPPERVFFCANGVKENANDFKNYLVPEHPSISISCKNNKVVEILFLSNLIVSKGILVLLEACELLKEKGLLFHCSIVGGEGDISELQLIQTISQMQLDEEVHYFGKKYGNDKHEHYVAADIFAFPTYYHNECFPLVLIESMIHSLPVVSTYEGAIPGIVYDGITGFLVPQCNANALAEKLEVLILNPTLRRKMGEAGREKYFQEFTLNAFEERFKDIILAIGNA